MSNNKIPTILWIKVATNDHDKIMELSKLIQDQIYENTKDSGMVVCVTSPDCEMYLVKEDGIFSKQPTSLP